MKFQYLVAAILSVFIYSCDSDLTDIGSNIQPSADGIVLKVDSFDLSSENTDPLFLYSRPDSLMLGTFYDKQFGTFHGDILTQLLPPIGVKFPTNAKADSATLFLSFTSAFGDKLAPFEVNVYHMDKKTLTPTELYKTDRDAAEFSSMNEKFGSKVTTINSYGIKRDSTLIRIKLDKTNFVEKYESDLLKSYTKDDAATFFTKIKGLYINTKFGASTLVNVKYIYLRYYYHYSYNHSTIKDSVVKVNFYQDFPATDEVRTISTVKLPQKTEVFTNFSNRTDINVISSPGNIYTNIDLPLAKIHEKLHKEVGSKKLLINRAMLRINVEELDSTTFALPIATTMLLINQDSLKKDDGTPKYFHKRSIPTSNESVLGTIAYEFVNNKIVYYYNFDMSRILTNELAKTTASKDKLKFRLIPVNLSYDSSQRIKDIKEKETISALKICSGTHPTKAMKLQLIYSGF